MSAPRDTGCLLVVAALAVVAASLVGGLTLALVDARAPAVAARYTARLAFGGFVLAYGVAPLARRARAVLAPVERLAWAGFVAAHAVHLGFLANNVLRQASHPPLWRAAGGIAAYTILAAIGLGLLATRPGAPTPRLRWTIDLGGVWITVVFVTTYLGRTLRSMPAPDGSSPPAWAGYPVLLVVAGALPLIHAAAVLRRPR